MIMLNKKSFKRVIKKALDAYKSIEHAYLQISDEQLRDILRDSLKNLMDSINILNKNFSNHPGVIQWWITTKNDKVVFSQNKKTLVWERVKINTINKLYKFLIT